VAPVARTAPSLADPSATIDKKPVPPTPQQLAAMSYQRGYEALRKGRREEAERELREALRHEPEHVAARESLAGMLLAAGRRVEAGEVLETGLALQPGTAGLRKLHARLLVEQGDLNGAVTSLEVGADGASNDGDYQALMAALYQRQGAFDKSVQRYQQALVREPRQGVWWLGLAISSEGAGQTQEAAGAYQRALDSGIGANLGTYARERLKALQDAAKAE
jgi:MSHA biogenesis protein MshN